MNAASVKLTEEIQRVWVPDTKKAEADRLRVVADQQYLKVVVEDDLDVEIELDQRSEGFQWLGVCAAEREELEFIAPDLRGSSEENPSGFFRYEEFRAVRIPVIGRVSGLLGSGFPDYAHSIIPFIRRKFTARVSRFHSPVTLSKPRRLNCRNPSTDLIHPKGGSPMCFLAR